MLATISATEIDTRHSGLDDRPMAYSWSGFRRARGTPVQRATECAATAVAPRHRPSSAHRSLAETVGASRETVARRGLCSFRACTPIRAKQRGVRLRRKGDTSCEPARHGWLLVTGVRVAPSWCTCNVLHGLELPFEAASVLPCLEYRGTR